MNRMLVLVLTLCAVFAAENNLIQVDGHAARSDRVVLQLDDTVAPNPMFDIPVDLHSGSALAEELLAEGVTTLTPLFHNWQGMTEAHLDHHLHLYYVATLSSRTDLQGALTRLEQIPAVMSAEPDYQAYATIVPNDTYYPDQWAHNNTGQAGSGNVGIPDCDTDTEEAWDITTGSSDIIIAILDTGINGSHSEFAGKMVPGFDFVNDDNDASDDNGHGTACGGIAAARGNNSSGIAGVSWESMLMPIKVLGAGGSGNDTDIANGITWAVDNGARIVSMSLSGGGYNGFLDNAVNYATDSGCVVFVATGNDNLNTCAYPSCYDNAVAVGALSPCNERKNPLSCDGEGWWGSNYGDHVDFLAPGVLINTTTMGGGYQASFNGTSSACPHAAGIGALVLSANPSLSAV